MRYVGNKHRLSKHIIPILKTLRKFGQTYVEPFCGSCSLLSQMENQRIANDNHYFLIEFLKASVYDNFEIPDYVSEDLYKEVKREPQKFHPALVGFVGFACSWGGKWFGGYARGFTNKGAPRNYTSEAKRNFLKYKHLLEGTIFYNLDFTQVEIPKNSLIYCDPPYSNTQKYSTEFDHTIFWQWAQEKFEEGHTVVISEYALPEKLNIDIEILFEKELVNNLNTTRAKERLYKLR